jgi:hypothetical protein
VGSGAEIGGRSGWSFGLWLWGGGADNRSLVRWRFGYEHCAPSRAFHRYRYRFRNRHGDLTVSPCLLHVPDRDGYPLCPSQIPSEKPIGA